MVHMNQRIEYHSGNWTSAADTSGTGGIILDLIAWVTPQQKSAMRENNLDSIGNPVSTPTLFSKTLLNPEALGVEGGKENMRKKVEYELTILIQNWLNFKPEATELLSMAR